MGYCPQTNALISSLNAFDHLRLFAKLRGIPPEKVDLEVNKWINRLSKIKIFFFILYLSFLLYYIHRHNLEFL